MEGHATEPVPPRFRQFKRWTLRAVVVLALLAGMRVWWGYEARRRLDAFVVEAHAQGRKVLPADFVRPDPVSAEQNAAPLLESAARGIVFTPQQRLWETKFAMALPLTAADRMNLAAIAAANRASLDSVRKARSLPQLDWRVKPGMRGYRTALAKLSGQRQLATLLGYLALYAHDAGDDAEAVELLLDLRYLAWSVRQIAPSVAAMLTGDGVSATLSEHALRIAPALNVARPPQRAATTRPAVRAQARELIERLLDDTDDRRAAADAWDGETMLLLDGSPQLVRQMEPRIVGALVRPMSEIDVVRAARARSAQRVAASQPTLPAAVAALPRDLGGMKSHLHQAVTAMSEMSGVGATPGLEAHFRGLTDRRAAAVILAIRLYRLEHDNALPATLDALVPDYISRVPLDPMARKARPMGYWSDPRGPCVHSVGANHQDDGGAFTHAERWLSRDKFYHIPPRTPRPAAAATRSGS